MGEYQRRAEETIRLLLEAVQMYVALDDRRRAGIRPIAVEWRNCWWAADHATAAAVLLAHDTEQGVFNTDKEAAV